MGTSVFAESIFHKKAIFLYTQVGKNMILRNTSFNGGFNIALINFIGEGYINTLEIKIKDIATDGSASNNTYEYLSNKINPLHKRESFRILKHEALKQNNRIAALDFHVKEMKTHLFELQKLKASINSNTKELFTRYINKYRPLFSIKYFHCKYKSSLPVHWLLILCIPFYKPIQVMHFKKSDRHFWSRVILHLNRLSNSYGINPGKGVLFTFLATLISYFIFLVSLKVECSCIEFDFHNIGNTVKYGIQFFNITEWNYEPFKIKTDLYSWSLIPLVFGRIVIGYGVFQTVKAFRKFGQL